MVALEKKLARPRAVITYGDSRPGSPAVMLTHGAGLDSTIFDSQAQALISHGYRVITWDLRGHGASTMEPAVSFTSEDAMADLVAPLDACKLAQVILVGHSFGGNLSQACTYAYPDRVAALFMIAATWKTTPLTRIERQALGLTVPLMQLVPAPVVRRLMVRSSVSTLALCPAARQLFAHIPKQRLLQVCSGTISLLKDSPYRPLPTAHIRGTTDPVTMLCKALPHWTEVDGLQDEPINDARHIVTWDAPQTTPAALLKMLAHAPLAR